MADDAAALIRLLTERGETVAVAESLTGGLLTALLTDPPGASKVVRGGLVVYATDTKASVAGVDAALLARVGPVALEVAAALAQGARSTFGSTYGIGLTGVAGPDRQDGHRVGEVQLAVAGPSGVVTASQDFADRGSRGAIRRAAAEGALALLGRVVREEVD